MNASLDPFYIKIKSSTVVYEYSRKKNVFKKHNNASLMALAISLNDINNGVKYLHTLNLHHGIALGVVKTSMH